MTSRPTDRIRVASLQYFIRPVRDFSEFAAQCEGLVETVADYGCRLAVFPEYLTLQLLTLADVRRPIREQIRSLADQETRVVELFGDLADKHEIALVAGTVPSLGRDGTLHNDCHVFDRNGKHGVQGKLHMTRFEREDWGVSARDKLRVFELDFGRIGVAICYDVEFPEVVRAVARTGAHILAVPSCTDDRQGFLRVRYCAHARAIENQMYVLHAGTVGSLPMVPAVSMNYGQASILTPSDFPFARDGILAEGNPNQEMVVIGELNMATIAESREAGTVLPLDDSRRSGELARTIEVVTL